MEKNITYDETLKDLSTPGDKLSKYPLPLIPDYLLEKELDVSHKQKSGEVK